MLGFICLEYVLPRISLARQDVELTKPEIDVSGFMNHDNPEPRGFFCDHIRDHDLDF